MSNTEDQSGSKIIVHSATWCAFCHAAKEYFDKLGVKYTDKDVEKDPAAGLEAVDKSSQRGIPVIDIDGEIIVGFDRPKIDGALKEKQLVAN
jgi:glutaredoxin-like YruB-family protein